LAVDSRSKILTMEQAAERFAGRGVRLVSGHFDPLLPEHARRLAGLAAPGVLLVVAVTDPPEPILPARARAELVAALRVVDCVVLGPGPRIPAEAVFDETQEDLRRARDFMLHVRARQGG
jgi:bifunctional ADP-heptose synthase (sugar kinase/adenylyltransferase)